MPLCYCCSANESKNLAWILKIILSPLNKYITITSDKSAHAKPCCVSPAILVNHCFFSTKLRLFPVTSLASPSLNALPCAFLCPLINLQHLDNVLFLPSAPLFTSLSKVIRGMCSTYDPYKHRKVIRTD